MPTQTSKSPNKSYKPITRKIFQRIKVTKISNDQIRSSTKDVI